jgi:hypothetical protein
MRRATGKYYQRNYQDQSLLHSAHRAFGRIVKNAAGPAILWRMA